MENRMGPYDDGMFRSCSNVDSDAIDNPLMNETIATGIITESPVVSFFDPLPPANFGKPMYQLANSSMGRTKNAGGVRSRNIVCRNGKFAILTPNQSTGKADISIFGSLGDLNVTITANLFKTTKGHYNTIGTEGRDLLPGWFTMYWDNTNHIICRSAGDTMQHLEINPDTQIARTGLLLTGSNCHGYLGISETGNFMAYSKSGHGRGSVSFNYVTDHDTKKFLAKSKDPTFYATDFNNPTYLCQGNYLYVLSPTSLQFVNKGVYYGGTGYSIHAYEYNDATKLFSQIWKTDVNNSCYLSTSTDGSTTSMPWCMDDDKIYFVYMLGNKFVLSIINRNDGSIFKTVMLPEVPTGGVYSNCQLSLYNDFLTIFDIEMGTLYFVDLVSNGITVYTYADLPSMNDFNFYYSDKVKMYGTPSHVYVCWLETVEPMYDYYLPTELIVHVDRFDRVTQEKKSLQLPISVYTYDKDHCMIDDFIAVDGRLYILATYRDHSYLHATLGGGQFFMVL